MTPTPSNPRRREIVREMIANARLWQAKVETLSGRCVRAFHDTGQQPANDVCVLIVYLVPLLCKAYKQVRVYEGMYAMLVEKITGGSSGYPVNLEVCRAIFST